MSIATGPNLKKLIKADDGDAYGTDMRNFLRMIDVLVQSAVKSRTTTAPPGSPADGDRYIVPAGATGAWSGKTDQIASWTTHDPANPSGVWEFFAPVEGWTVWSTTDAVPCTYHSGSWLVGGGTSGVISVAGKTGVVTLAEADVVLSNVTTSDVSTTKHGYAPKAPNDATKYLDGTGVYSVPAGGGGGGGGAPAGTMHAFVFNSSATPGAGNQIGAQFSNTGAGGGAVTVANTSPSGSAPSNYRLTSGTASYGEFTDGSGGNQTLLSQLDTFRFWGRLVSAGSGNFFIGFLGGIGNIWNTANPATALACFRFIQGTDTHWQAYVSTNGSTFTAVDTGITPDSNWHLFTIKRDPSTGTLTFYIDGVSVATIATSATGFPSAAMNAGIANNAPSGTVAIEFHSIIWWSTN